MTALEKRVLKLFSLLLWMPIIWKEYSTVKAGHFKSGKPEVISLVRIPILVTDIIITSYHLTSWASWSLWKVEKTNFNRSLLKCVWRPNLEGFLVYQNTTFLVDRHTVGLMMNIDWFQPFKHRSYSIGIVYLVIMNLQRNIRYKRENILIIGLLPGPSEPPKTINTYLAPLVSELLTLWRGKSFKTADKTSDCSMCTSLYCLWPASK